jgi:glucokinase
MTAKARTTVHERSQIVADIGGTNARFAFVRTDDDRLSGIEVFPCADFAFLADAISAYIERGHAGQVDHICLAVAGPVENDWIDLPNNHWAFSRSDLEGRLGVPVDIINDFSAQVLCIDGLQDTELQWLGTPRPKGHGVKAVIGPGTGLGVSAMMASGEIVPSEAGHVAFAPVNDHEADLLKILWQRYHRVSVERVLSGMGLANLYWANCRLDGQCRELPAPEITAGALAGDKYCLRAVNDFYAILASMAGDVALMMGAADGVYLSGGILPRILHLLDEELFLQRFQDKGRFKEFNSAVPLAIVRTEHPGLLGCVQALRNTRAASK